ncbi:MAG: hypothetical protein F6K08_05190 [Okeania sp. SIO1H6]|nr:hypothetical protein [Okeania sp. SIO1H6]
MAASIKEIQQNIIKIQGLIKQAQNPAQKKTFSEILNNLQGQLEEALKKQKSTQKTSQKLEIQKIVKSIEPEQKSTTESLLAAKLQSKPLPETTQKLEPKSTTKTTQKLEPKSTAETTQKLEPKSTTKTTQKLEPKPTPAISTSPLSETQNTPPIQAESEPLPEPPNTPVIPPEQEQKTSVESTTILSESEPIAKDKSETKTSNKIFQGLGIIEGKIIKRFEDNDKYYNVVVGEKTYKLIIHRRRVLDFVKATYNPDETQLLLVYPNLVHYRQPKERTLPLKISFTIVAVLQELRHGLKVNEFRLCGIYQQIGLYSGTVISVHRNKTEHLKHFVNRNKDRAKNLLRANHIPIFWEDSPVKPFQYNPNLDKDKQADRYFVEIKAQFLPDREQWGFIELLGEPTLQLPDFMKPPKPGGTKSKSDNKEKVEKMNQELDTKQ